MRKNGLHDSPVPLKDVIVNGNESSNSKPANRNSEILDDLIDDSSPYYKDRQ